MRFTDEPTCRQLLHGLNVTDRCKFSQLTPAVGQCHLSAWRHEPLPLHLAVRTTRISRHLLHNYPLALNVVRLELVGSGRLECPW